MNTRHLFLPLLICLVGSVSCEGWLPEDVKTTGTITVDKKFYCTLNKLEGAESDGKLKWGFFEGEDMRVSVQGYVCRDNDPTHLHFHMELIKLELPDVATSMEIPLEGRKGDRYLSGNKSVSEVVLNKYEVSKDGELLKFDLTITLYRETKGDIRVQYFKGPIL